MPGEEEKNLIKIEWKTRRYKTSHDLIKLAIEKSLREDLDLTLFLSLL